jgi:hypothetical protein
MDYVPRGAFGLLNPPRRGVELLCHIVAALSASSASPQGYPYGGENRSRKLSFYLACEEDKLHSRTRLGPLSTNEL